jgi:hypothetical protein
VAPVRIAGLNGVTAIDESVFTVNCVDPLTVPREACIVDWPAATAVANPELLIVATPVAVELQLTDEVRS